MPRLRNKDELRQEVSIKKKWVTPGYKNDFFQVPPIMKPKVLNEWVASRVQAPDRTFKKLSLQNQDDFRYTHSSINDCGDPPTSTLSDRFRTNLQT